jgi:hypothetical protein
MMPMPTYQPSLFAPLAAASAPISCVLPVAASQEAPAGHVSSRYGFIRTHEILAQLQGFGFKIESASGNQHRHGKHIVRLRHDAIHVPGVGVSENADLQLRFTVLNSHDGSSSYRVSLELYDQHTGALYSMCNTWSCIRVRHNNRIAVEAPEATIRLGDHAPRVGALINTLQCAPLNRRQLGEFVEAAVQARWGTRRVIDAARVLEQLREGMTAWRTLEIVQGALLNGNLLTLRGRTTRIVRSPTERLRIQQALWSIAEEMSLGEDDEDEI